MPPSAVILPNANTPRKGYRPVVNYDNRTDSFAPSEFDDDADDTALEVDPPATIKTEEEILAEARERAAAWGLPVYDQKPVDPFSLRSPYESPVTIECLMSYDDLDESYALPYLGVHGQISSIYALAGAGKSTLIRAGVRMRYFGGHFLGNDYPPQPELPPVLWFGEESRTSWEGYHKESPLPPNLRLMRRDPRVRLGFKEWEDWIYAISEMVVRCGIDLVVVDTLSVFTPWPNENDAACVQPYMDVWRDFTARTHCALILLGHSNKSGGSRGTEAIVGSTDLRFELTRGKGNIRKINQWGRRGECKWAYRLADDGKIEWHDTDPKPATAEQQPAAAPEPQPAADAAAKLQADIMDALRTPRTRDEVLAIIKKRKSDVLSAMKSMREAKLIGMGDDKKYRIL